MPKGSSDNTHLPSYYLQLWKLIVSLHCEFKWKLTMWGRNFLKWVYQIQKDLEYLDYDMYDEI